MWPRCGIRDSDLVCVRICWKEYLSLCRRSNISDRWMSDSNLARVRTRRKEYSPQCRRTNAASIAVRTAVDTLSVGDFMMWNEVMIPVYYILGPDSHATGNISRRFDDLKWSDDPCILHTRARLTRYREHHIHTYSRRCYDLNNAFFSQWKCGFKTDFPPRLLVVTAL